MNKAMLMTIYCLESVDLKKEIGVLKFKPSEPKNAKWTKVDVSLSYELKKWLKNEWNRGLKAGDSLVGTNFTSTVNSREFSENPFRLVKFIPVKNSDIPTNYKLEMVFEKMSLLDEVSDALNRKYGVWKKQSYRPNQYMRYMEVEVDKLLKDCVKLKTIVLGKNRVVCIIPSKAHDIKLSR